MKLSDKTYDLCKLIGTIVLPALAVFYTSLAAIWGLPFAEQVPKTIMAVDLLFNTCLGFSTANYYKELAKADEVLKNNLIDEEADVYPSDVGEG